MGAEEERLQAASGPAWAGRLRENLARVRQTIADACARSGRDASEVRLVAVTKYVDLPVIRELLAAGIADVGESRVQQLVPRAAAFGSRLDGWPERVATAGGQPATAAARAALAHDRTLAAQQGRGSFCRRRIIHSLDSVRLAAEVDRVAEEWTPGWTRCSR